jgi:hypothetical protein
MSEKQPIIKVKGGSSSDPIPEEKELPDQALKDLDLVKEVLGSPERVKGLISLIKEMEKKKERKLPPGYSDKSNPSYYREQYALEMKKILDLMINPADGSFTIRDQVIEYKKMHSVNKYTLYQRIIMGWKYLCDYLDPTGKYKEIRLQTRCSHEHRGISIRWKSNLIKYLGTESLLNARSEIPTGEQSISWKKELEDFILNAENNQVFKKSNIILTDGQIQIVKGMLVDLPGFIPVEISRNKVIVMFNDTIERWEAK